MKTADIPKLISRRSMSNPVSIRLCYLQAFLNDMKDELKLNLSPSFQRDHVWNMQQRIRYVEFILRGGITPPIVFNSPVYYGDYEDNCDLEDELVIVDGLQRLTSILMFLDNKLSVFGNNYLIDFDDQKSILRTQIFYFINDLQTKKELLQWYLEMNEGFVQHSESELNKVREMIKDL